MTAAHHQSNVIYYIEICRFLLFKPAPEVCKIFQLKNTCQDLFRFELFILKDQNPMSADITIIICHNNKSRTAIGSNLSQGTHGTSKKKLNSQQCAFHHTVIPRLMCHCSLSYSSLNCGTTLENR